MRLHLPTALGLNAVPAYGWFIGDWSAGTILLLYWLETVAGTLLVAGRIALHRRRVRSEGHWYYRAPQPAGEMGRTRNGGTYLSAFLVPMLFFSAVHGIFLAVLGFMMASKRLTPEATVQWEGLRVGVASLLFFQGVDFLIDLIGLGRRPFRWLEQLGQRNFGRVAVMQLTIMGGMAAVMFTGADRDFFGVFIFLKTMLNLSSSLPQYNPKTPPRWLCSLMDRIGTPEADGTTFADHWRKTDEQEATRLERNDMVHIMPAAK